MKRPTMLVIRALLQDAGRYLDLSVERDVATLLRRWEHESDMFLQVTLPLLSDALERGLEAGSFTCPTNFSRHGSLPRLLGGFFKRVFSKDGRLLPDACPDAVYCIRQICRFFKKQKIGCKARQNEQAIKHFLEVEGELRRATPNMERKDEYLDKISRLIWPQVFPEVDSFSLVCNHGPGVTADRRLSNERHRISKWNHRSELTFPSDLHCYPNYGCAADVALERGEERGTESVEGLEYLRIRDELPVRVVFVPKTQSAPRVIAIEPSHMQFMQQSIKDLMYTAIEGHSLTKHSIRFGDQSVNQRLAYRSSIDKRLATLDLKDASDRVHLHLVQRIFKTSGLLEYLEDARSLHATLPNEQNIVLFKYASMGSALCFPVEACVFYTLIQSAMHQLDGRRPSSRSIARYSKQISVYGDDIIIPVEYTDVVVSYLESYSLKVNVNKSFRFSNFRESCGADFYKGIPVNPVYARMELHDDLRHWGADTVMSWNATADLFYMRGFWETCQTIRDLLSRVVRRTIPKSRKLGSGIAHFSYLFDTDLFYNKDLCGWKQKRLHYDPVKRKDSIDGDELACLNKWGRAVLARDGEEKSSRFDKCGVRSRPPGFRSGAGEPIHSHPRDGKDLFPVYREGRAGSQYWNLDSRIRDCSVRRIPDSDDIVGTFVPTIQSMAGPDCATGSGSLEQETPGSPGFDFSADYCLTEEVQSDPLRYLIGDNNGIDFLTSTKRGSFKSKCRWVSLAS